MVSNYSGRINLKKPAAELFADTAECYARELQAATNKRINNTTQLRRFYDQLVMWDERLSVGTPAQREENFAQAAPFIQMLRAQTAYAKGRDLVDSAFVDMMNELLGQVQDVKTLHMAKLFFEAVMGFKKAMEPK